MLSAGVLLAASLCAQPPSTGGSTEAARPLTAQGLENLQALARMIGFVRYFYPSDEAAGADWNRFAVEAVKAVEPASSPADLAAKLQSVFAPVAPQVRVMTAGAPRPLMEMQSGPMVVLYQYRGLGPPQGRPGPFYSTRFLVPPAQALIAFAPFRADLPGGVTCMVPLALYRSQGPLAQPPPLPPPGGSLEDRAVRLAAVMVAWNVYQNFYPYIDQVGPVWLAALGRLLSEAATDKDAAAFHATLLKMTAVARDGQSRLNGPGAPPDYVPPVAWTVAEGRITALGVQGTADVKPGDALVSIDGQPAADVLEAKEKFAAGSTPQAVRELALPYLLARAQGAKVQVELESLGAGGAKRAVALECSVRAGDLHPPRPEKIAEIEPGIFYVDLDRVTDSEFNAGLAALSKARGIVYDLRGDSSRMPQFFTVIGRLLNRQAQGPPMAVPIVTRPDGGETFYQENQWLASPMPPYLGAKRAFLTDGRTTGAAETILAMVSRYRLGEIVGEASGGMNGTLNSFTMPGGFDLTFTAERVRQDDGSPLFGAGIPPTAAVAPTRAAIAAGRDEALERALQAVR